MIETSGAYQTAIVGDTRKMLVQALVEILDPDFVSSGVVGSSQAVWSRADQLLDKRYERTRYATLERGRWILDGTFPLMQSTELDGDIGFVSRAVSGDDGTFTDPPWAELQFSGVSILQACSLFFSQDVIDGVPENFTVEIKSGGTAYHTESYTGNTASRVDVSGFTVYNPDAIRITVSKWSLPGRRMRLTEILPGVYEEWENGVLASCEIKQQGDFSCLSLPYGTCSIRLDNKDRRFEPRNKVGFFQSIEERQGIDLSLGTRLADGTWYLVKLGRFYQYSGGWRTGDNDITIQWELVDIVGLLAQREYIPPSTLPTTLEGWAASLVGQLGDNFADLYAVDGDYEALELTAELEDIQGKTCGQIIRWAAMATGTWPRADAETGKLTFEPYWYEGNKLTLDNLESYPTIKANNDLAALIFTLADDNRTQYVISGNTAASSQTVSVSNPFIHTQEQALSAARHILSTYGGNKLETTGRGDPSSEIGDVDTVWLDESSATTARRMMQTFRFQDGVLRGCQTTLLQADGSFLWESREMITESGTWTAPSGVTQIRYFIVGPGSDGADGEDGTYDAAGSDGADGAGGRVLSGVLDINEEQVLEVSISDTETTLGNLSSANGKVYANGYTDIGSGDSFARAGVSVPLDGSGDGGKGGKGGVKGNKHSEVVYEDTWLGHLPVGTVTVIDNKPGKGTSGSKGALGCVVLYWEDPDV